jgi:PKD repeat protein
VKQCKKIVVSKIKTVISITLLLIALGSCSKPTKKPDIVIKIEATPTEGLPPLEVLLDASLSYDKSGIAPLQFVWEFPDGSTFEGPIVLKGFEEPGVYTIRLKVSNGISTTT